MQFNDEPLLVGQLGEGAGELKQLFLVADAFAGRRLFGGEPGVQPRRGFVDGLFDGDLNGDLALVFAGHVDEAVGEDAPQPCGLFGGRAAAKLLAVLVGLDERLLHDVGRIEFAAQPRVELEAGQQMQVIPVVFQLWDRGSGLVRHNSYLGLRRMGPMLRPRGGRIFEDYCCRAEPRGQ